MNLTHPTTLLVPAGIAALGVYGLRLTRFERTPTGLFYTPNAHLGIALSLLLVLRLGYRGGRLPLHLCRRPAALEGTYPDTRHALVTGPTSSPLTPP